MATLTQSIFENPTQSVSARYGRSSAGVVPAPRSASWPERSCKTALHLTTPTGNALSCRRHNGQWYNFLIPSETSHLLLEIDAGQGTDRIVADLVLFIGGREENLTIPAQDAAQKPNEAPAAPLRIDLPHIPHWVTALLCIRLTQMEQNHAEWAA